MICAICVIRAGIEPFRFICLALIRLAGRGVGAALACRRGGWLAPLLLAACSAPLPIPSVVPPPLAPAQLQALDREIAAAAQAALEPARAHAEARMAVWQQRVGERTESEFIDWFTGYWTQQWLAIKVGWYRLQSENDPQQTADRLAAYLQQAYADRVLQPVADEIDPQQVQQEASRHYVQALGLALAGLPRRLDVEPGQLAQRLKQIPAIRNPVPASVHELVRSEPVERLPAYAAWQAELAPPGMPGGGLVSERITPVARRASAILLDRLALSGASSAASALIGGLGGMAISLATAGANLLLHQEEKRALELELRNSLGEAVQDLAHTLRHDPDHGVLAGAYALARQIAASFPETRAQPIAWPTPPEERPLPEGKR